MCKAGGAVPFDELGASRQPLLFVVAFASATVILRQRWRRASRSLLLWLGALLALQIALCALVYDVHISASGVYVRDLTTIYRYATVWATSGADAGELATAPVGTDVGSDACDALTPQKDVALYAYYARRALHKVAAAAPPAGVAKEEAGAPSPTVSSRHTGAVRRARCSLYRAAEGVGVFERRLSTERHYEVCMGGGGGGGGGGREAPSKWADGARSNATRTEAASGALRIISVSAGSPGSVVAIVPVYTIIAVHTLHSVLGALLALMWSAGCKAAAAEATRGGHTERGRYEVPRRTLLQLAIVVSLCVCAFSGVDEYIADTRFPLGIVRAFVVFVTLAAVAYCFVRPPAGGATAQSGSDSDSGGDYDLVFLRWFAACTLLIACHFWLPVHAWLYTPALCVTLAVAMGCCRLGTPLARGLQRAADRVERALFVGGRPPRRWRDAAGVDNSGGGKLE